MTDTEILTDLVLNYGHFDHLSMLGDLYQSRKIRSSKRLLRLLGYIWTSCDNISECMLDGFNWVFEEVTAENMTPETRHVPLMMTKKERKALAALPENVTVYRGCGPEDMYGYSWTLDRDIAVLHVYKPFYKQEKPMLLTLTIDRKYIMALKLDRGEAEVVVEPSVFWYAIQQELLPVE
jgi:hypothetical protein